MRENRFKGERLDSKGRLARNNLIEHLARYNLVQGRKNSVVLDIGCGSGHGSFALSKRFKMVYGVDIAQDAIAYARKNWTGKNIHFQTGSGTNIPFPSGTFDMTVAYEVFEHIKDWRAFLSEMKRVTKKGGKVYISTPNKNMYSPGTLKPINPYHQFEMTPKEFKSALEECFTIEHLYGQRTPVYNDHWIWKIVDPLLFMLKDHIPYTFNNTLKLRIINVIKPKLEPTDVVFGKKKEWVERSRFMVAKCTKVK